MPKKSNHYFLPNINVSFLDIPKTGSTSIKNYLLALEQEVAGVNIETAAPTQFLGYGIHGNPVIKNSLIKNLRDKRAQQSLKILILRNPYQRVLSGWVNKLLFAQNDYAIFHELRHEPFTPVDFSSFEDLEQAFAKFTEKLSQDKKFLHSNAHWLPQVEFFSDVSDYDVVLETLDIARLEGILGKHLGFRSQPNRPAFPQFNQTKSLLVSHLGTTRAWDYVQSAYSEDLAVMAKAGLNAKRPDEHQIRMDPIPAKVFESEKIRILESRSISELKFLRNRVQGLQNQIEHLKASRSWRATAWLRWISEPWLRSS